MKESPRISEALFRTAVLQQFDSVNSGFMRGLIGFIDTKDGDPVFEVGVNVWQRLRNIFRPPH
jgi:hypothetical protein